MGSSGLTGLSTVSLAGLCLGVSVSEKSSCFGSALKSVFLCTVVGAEGSGGARLLVLSCRGGLRGDWAGDPRGVLRAEEQVSDSELTGGGVGLETELCLDTLSTLEAWLLSDTLDALRRESKLEDRPPFTSKGRVGSCFTEDDFFLGLKL